MPEHAFRRHQDRLAPADESSREWLAKVPHGAEVVITAKLPRNAKFHRKFFAMLKVAYDNWPKPVMYYANYGEVTCDFETFRGNLICMAGYSEAVVNIRGEVRVRPKSIAWASMDQDEFDRLYSACVDVILAKFLPSWDAADLDRAAEEFILGFA